MLKKKLLLVGPFAPPITGVSICNETIFKELSTTFKISKINTAGNSFKENIGHFSISKLFNFLKTYFFIRKVFSADILYLTIGQTFFGVLKYLPFLVVAKVLNKKILIHLHGNHLGKEYKNLTGIKKWLFKKTITLSDKGIVLSESLKQNFDHFLSDNNVFVLYNFIDKKLLDISENQIKEKNLNSLHILYLSNLMSEKGVLDLLDALYILEKKQIPYKASFAGNIDPKIKDNVFLKIQRLKDTSYLGVIKGEEKKNVLMQSNVFVFPTYYKMEGQPISLLEAMALGNLIITTDHAGIKDIIKKDNGFFIPKKDPESIVKNLENIINNPQNFEHILLNNHKYVKKNFTEKKFLEKLTKILLEL